MTESFLLQMLVSELNFEINNRVFEMRTLEPDPESNHEGS